MGLIDSTNVISSAMSLKARLDKNMVPTNYYLQSLQEKRNSDWLMRYNVVDIEEELQKQLTYTSAYPNFTPIEVVIQSVKDERGQDLGIDWAEICFKDLQHPNAIGDRYRFDLEFPNMSTMTEDEKFYQTCVWLAVNKSPINPGNSCVIRRCNGSIALQGSPTNEYNNITEIRYEPVVLENDLKYINLYYNQTLVVPQAEWYATMQMNYFTNSIKINDRFIFGGIDSLDRTNNSVYKVKAIVKASSTRTFSKPGATEVDTIPLIIIAMDKDVLAETDDLSTRVATGAPIYKVLDENPQDEYYIKLSEQDSQNNLILTGQTETYNPELMLNEEVQSGIQFSYTLVLGDLDYTNYCDFVPNYENGANSFSVTCLKKCNVFNLTITITATIEEQTITKDFEIELGGFY